MSKFYRHVNIDIFLRHFDVFFCCSFDKRIINIILMYIFDIMSMDRKSTQLQRASFDVLFLNGKKLSQCPLLINVQ